MWTVVGLRVGLEAGDTAPYCTATTQHNDGLGLVGESMTHRLMVGA